MSIRLYFDHNVRGAVVAGLRLREVDVLTAYEDGTHELDDPALLDPGRDDVEVAGDDEPVDPSDLIQERRDETLVPMC